MLVLGFERGADHAGGGVVDDDAVRAGGGELVHDPRVRDVPAHEHGLGSRLLHERRRLVGR